MDNFFLQNIGASGGVGVNYWCRVRRGWLVGWRSLCFDFMIGCSLQEQVEQTNHGALC